MHTYLNVPYARRNEAKAAGAEWDADFHKWKINGSRKDMPDSLRIFAEGSLDDPEIIHVGLYGGKSRLSTNGKFEPLKANIVACTKSNDCPLAKHGRCTAVTSTSNPGCPHARYGQVTQNKADRGFRERIEALPKYNALKSCQNVHFAIVADNIAILTTKLLGVAYDPEYKLNDTMCPPTRLKSNDAIAIDRNTTWDRQTYLPLDCLTPDVLHEILNERPRNFGRYEITEYRKETVPRILAEMSEQWPEGFEALGKKYPEDTAKRSDIGRLAYLRTCRQGAEWTDRDDNVWVVEGDRFICHNFRSYTTAPGMNRVPEGTIVSIPITEDHVVEVTDQDQVEDNTMFL